MTPTLLNKKIPSLTLQLLIENVIKHNIINMENPMVIHLDYSDKDQTLSVRNKIKLKKDVAKSGMGLKNLSARYLLILIRNERRLELCFEGFRFWDLRRWNMDLNEPAKGIRISGGTYQVFNVESRTYNDFMRFGPIPYSEVVKFDALEQNKGWD